MPDFVHRILDIEVCVPHQYLVRLELKNKAKDLMTNFSTKLIGFKILCRAFSDTVNHHMTNSNVNCCCISMLIYIAMTLAVFVLQASQDPRSRGMSHSWQQPLPTLNRIKVYIPLFLCPVLLQQFVAGVIFILFNEIMRSKS